METLQTHEELPAHCAILATPEVWIDGDAVAQLGRVARLDGCVRAVGMPDLHAGPGIPIGAAFAFERRILPDLIGGDAGCGVSLVAFPKPKHSGDALLRRLTQSFGEAAVGCSDAAGLLSAVWEHGCRGLGDAGGLPDVLVDGFVRATSASTAPLPEYLADIASLHVDNLGTIGGGNHFAELGRVSEARPEEEGPNHGCRRGSWTALAHSGSRSLGQSFAQRWHGLSLEGEQLDRYTAELEGVCRFAEANRVLLIWRLLRAAGVRPASVRGGLDLIHNSVAREQVGGRPHWVHRKGCAPAGKNQPTIVLGSRGAPSWLLEGLGSEASLSSVAHGAGRRMSRNEARNKLAKRHGKKPSRTRVRDGSGSSTLVGRVICPDRDLLLEEHPDAYKPIEPVIRSLELAGAARRIAAIVPEVTVKC